MKQTSCNDILPMHHSFPLPSHTLPGTLPIIPCRSFPFPISHSYAIGCTARLDVTYKHTHPLSHINKPTNPPTQTQSGVQRRLPTGLPKQSPQHRGVMLSVAQIARWLVRPVDSVYWLGCGLLGGVLMLPSMVASLQRKGRRYASGRPVARSCTPTHHDNNMAHGSNVPPPFPLSLDMAACLTLTQSIAPTSA